MGARAAGLGQGAARVVAGTVFSGATILVWGQPAPLLVPATAAFVAGAAAGGRLSRGLSRPTGPRVAPSRCSAWPCRSPWASST